MELDLITVRKASAGDAHLIAGLGAKVFSQAFAAQNSTENMALYLAEAFSPFKQARELAEPGGTFFIIEHDNTPAGYARLQDGSKRTYITGANPIELVRFYVLQEWVGKGVAAILMKACLDEVKKCGYDVIWLSAWKENPRAIAFYRDLPPV